MAALKLAGLAGIQVPLAVAGTWLALMALLVARIRRGPAQPSDSAEAQARDEHRES